MAEITEARESFRREFGDILDVERPLARMRMRMLIEDVRAKECSHLESLLRETAGSEGLDDDHDDEDRVVVLFDRNLNAGKDAVRVVEKIAARVRPRRSIPRADSPPSGGAMRRSWR